MLWFVLRNRKFAAFIRFYDKRVEQLAKKNGWWKTSRVGKGMAVQRKKVENYKTCGRPEDYTKILRSS